MNNRRRKNLEIVANYIKDLMEGDGKPEKKELERISEKLTEIADEEDDATMNMPENLFATDRYQDMLDNMCDIMDAATKVNDVVAGYETLKWTGCKAKLNAAIKSIYLAINR